MTDTLLLTGANGRTGRAILKSLVFAKIPVRVFIRNEVQAEDLLEMGASEVAVGDFSEPESLVRAADGVEKILHIGPPMHPDECEITTQLIEIAKSASVKHFIYYSVLHPVSRTIRHHRLKLDAEERLIDSGLPYTIVQPSRYMQHLEPIWASVVEKGVHAMPFSTSQQFSVVDLADLADACAVIASSNKYLYGTYELAGPERLSQEQMAETLSSILGRSVKAAKTPIRDMQEKARSKGASEDRIEQMSIMNNHYDAHGFRCNAEVLQQILGRPANTYSGYVRRLVSREVN